MTAATLLDPCKGEDLGLLAANGMTVRMLQTTLSRAETNANTIPLAILNLSRQNAWRAFVFPDNPGAVFRWNAADFRRFIESPRPAGCQTPLDLVERMLRGTDAWEVFQELIRGERGGANNPYGCVGKPETGINRYPVTVDSPPTIPLPAKSRDYSREARTGNSVSYALRRLGKERPDLYERVKAGELAAKTAMREAGFITPEFSIPVEPEGAARRILKRFRGEQLAELIRALSDHADH